jgi:hypothetical protein
MTISISRFLRLVLVADAVASGLTGLLLLAGAGLLESLLGLPAGLMREAGLVLVPYVTFVGWLASRSSTSVWSIDAVIACNAVWALASVLLLVSGFVSPTLLGYAFVIAQAATVALFGVLQYAALRMSGTAIA